jgi:hypothetical protein
MAARSSHDNVGSAPEVVSTGYDDGKKDIAQVERVLSADTGLEKDHINYDRIDKELAKYANATAVEISPEENQRLKKLINQRVLPIMIFTYFLQALDKGTMSFTAIMGIRDDIPVLANSNQVRLVQGELLHNLKTDQI